MGFVDIFLVEALISGLLLGEGLRIGFGPTAVGWDNLIDGLRLVVFIIFLPKGILGSMMSAWGRTPARAVA